MVECADLTLLAADAFAYERPQRDPPSSVRRPGSAIFVQYGPAPDLEPLRTSSLNWKTRLSGTSGAGGRVFEFPFAHHLSRDLLGPSYFHAAHALSTVRFHGCHADRRWALS